MRGIGGPPGGEGFAFTGRANLREITDKPGVEFFFRKGCVCLFLISCLMD